MPLLVGSPATALEHIPIGALRYGRVPLLGPATFVKHGLSLLWVTLVAIFFQTMFNLELMRYTLATGETALTARPSC